MLPDKIMLENGEVVTIKEYCNSHCPQRHNSECFSDCDLERDIEENEAWQYRDDD